MNVVHVNDIAFVGSLLVDGLRVAGVDARLLKPRTPGASWPYPPKLLTMPLRAWHLAATALQLRREDVDIVHVHYATQALPGLLSGRPYVVHCHGSDIRGVRTDGLVGRLILPLLARAAIVLYSTPDLSKWVERFRTDAVFLPNPINPVLFAPGNVDEVDVLVPTKLDPIKGSDEIIDVVRHVRSLRPETTFTIIAHGAGSQRAVEAAGTNTTVIQPVAHGDMPSLLRRHRIAVGQFRLGILSQVELESMAAGVPIATPFRYHTAYASPPPLMAATSVEEAAWSITNLLDNRDSQKSLATAGRAWVTQNHDVSEITRRLLGIYRNLHLVRAPEESPRP